ncbi:phage head-tail joining protein [Variibacter gotjawalensis]|uniref:Phage head-tail joining protein n=1 Tax=Variibacter gotjawalensis TaxID=1333996 RepID=A0A0S3PZ48_9BRAD|nr:head-tail adaptor protein [Variibacter gotjawalensis]NIK47063.1 SPP1 family predicted phage head-tail adaptor [Variibacter gotjawalensis]RZS48968.1 SPP1 family predicted phage head-tail adaptor [Variibacter gotjawalensis]BAT61226.1 phage head-tail joining protein [Variibacter gotjawalensis]
MIDPGQLKTRLTVEKPIETPDGAGGVTRGYAVAATVWAAVNPVSLRFATVAEAPGTTVTHMIVVRAPLDVGVRHRLSAGPRVFRVIAVCEQDADGRFLLIRAEERRD